MLPIWERWTDGSLAARQLLDCESANLVTREQLFQHVLVAMQELQRRDTDSRVRAALAAAYACCAAYVGTSAARLDLACVRALDADAVAHRLAV